MVLLLEAWRYGEFFFRLHEFPKFSRNVLEVMRQPLKERMITISCAKYSTEYPDSLMLVVSMNLSAPTGTLGITRRLRVQRVLSKISGSLLDRSDLQIEMQPVNFDQLLCKQSAMSNSFEDCQSAANRSHRQLSSKAPDELSAVICQRVIAARAYIGSSNLQI